MAIQTNIKCPSDHLLIWNTLNWHCTRRFLCKRSMKILSEKFTFGIYCFEILLRLFEILLRYKSSASLLTPSGISTFPVVANLLANPLQWKRLCAYGLPTETWFILSSLLCFKNPFPIAVEILVLIAATRFLATIRYFWILASDSFSNMRLLCFLMSGALLGQRFLIAASLILTW